MARGRKKKRWGLRVFLTICAAIAGVSAYNYLAPTLTAQSVTQYTAYPVENQTISALMSFGGSVAIRYSEAVSVSETSTVREVYVTSAQSVKKGDKLIQLEDGRILTAGIDGVINQLRANAGGWAPANMTLVQVCDLTNMQISMSVDEYDITDLFVGQPCSVYILSLGMTFDTQIAHINRVSSSSGTVASYTVGIELTVPAEVLPGMQASVSIPLETAEDVPALPMSALAFDEEGAPFVYVKTGEGGYEPRALTLGLNDGMYAQVLSGLALGDTAYTAETVEISGEGFTLASLYKQVFGEIVVVNEGERGGRSRGAQSGAALPEGMTLPEGATLPEGMTLPEDATMPQSNTALPEDAAKTQSNTALPEDAAETQSNTALPEDAAKTQSNTSSPEDAAETQSNTSSPEDAALPDGAANTDTGAASPSASRGAAEKTGAAKTGTQAAPGEKER